MTGAEPLDLDGGDDEPGDGWVTVRVTHVDGLAVLTVLDDGQ